MSMDAFELQELSRLQRIEREYIALRASTERVEYAQAMYGGDLSNLWRHPGYGAQKAPALPPDKKPIKPKLLLLCRSN